MDPFSASMTMGGRGVDGFNPYAKYARQIGSCPQTLVVNKKNAISETTTQSLLHEVEWNPTGYFQLHESSLYPFKSWLVEKDSQ